MCTLTAFVEVGLQLLHEDDDGARIGSSHEMKLEARQFSCVVCG